MHRSRQRPAPVILLPLIATMALAGCVAGSTIPTTPGMPIPEPHLDLDLVNDGEHCREGAAIFLVEPAQAARHLPEGFRPADAQALLGLPTPTGKAAIILAGYGCEAAALDPAGLTGSELNIAVEPPQVPGDREPADGHYYQLGIYTEGPLRDALESIGWAVLGDGATVEVEPLPSGSARATFAADGESGRAYEATVTAGAPATLQGRMRFWHVTPTGTAWVDYVVDAAVAVGTIECTLRPGSPAARIVGATTCHEGNALGLVAPSVDWQSNIHHRQGVRPTVD